MRNLLYKVLLCVLVASASAVADPVNPEPITKLTSGIYGYSSQRGDRAADEMSAAYDYDLLIQDAKSRKTIMKSHTKNNGNFTITLPPGRHIITPLAGRNRAFKAPDLVVSKRNEQWFSKQADVTVWKNFRTFVWVFFNFD